MRGHKDKGLYGYKDTFLEGDFLQIGKEKFDATISEPFSSLSRWYMGQSRKHSYLTFFVLIQRRESVFLLFQEREMIYHL